MLLFSTGGVFGPGWRGRTSPLSPSQGLKSVALLRKSLDRRHNSFLSILTCLLVPVFPLFARRQVCAVHFARRQVECAVHFAALWHLRSSPVLVPVLCAVHFAALWHLRTSPVLVPAQYFTCISACSVLHLY